MKSLQKYRDILICIFLLGLPFFFLHSNLKDPKKLNPLDKLLLKISAPIQYVSTAIAKRVLNIWETYIYLVDVKDMNEQLQYENARLMAENQQYFQILKENYRLRRLLGLQKRTKLNLVSASVIAKSLSPFFRVLRIRLDQGKDIVKPGMAVITYEGLVGQIERVFKDYSDVLLTVDRKSLVDVVVFRTGSQALLQGTGEDYRYACKIEYLERKEDVREGDEVFTSGLGQKFPSGILVGRITRIIQKNFGLYQEVEVTPSVDFSRIKEVFVVLSPFTSQKK